MSHSLISRREFLHRMGLTGVALAALPNQQLLAKSTIIGQAKPNILLIFSDQQHWQALGFLNSFFQTPNLDEFARQSVVFENCFCTTPQCSPSRSSLLTGLYPSKTGVIENLSAYGGQALSRATVGAEMKTAGYTTCYAGKWHLGNQEISLAGWNEHYLEISDHSTENRAVSFLRNVATANEPFALIASFINPHDIYGYRKHKIVNRGESIPLPTSWGKASFSGKPAVQEQFMRQDQGKDIHGQDRGEWERYRDCYRSKTELYDHQFGVIMNELKQQGLWDNTVVIVTSDHGDMDTNHRLIFKGPFMYEHLIRIPLMIRVPSQYGGTESRTISDLDVVNVDIVPTIRDLCGLPAVDCDGISLSPLLTGTGSQETREYVIGQYYRKQNWACPIRMIRARNYKFNRYIHHGEELYDLENDPCELFNLAQDSGYVKTKRELSSLLDRWIEQNRDPFFSLTATSVAGKALE